MKRALGSSRRNQLFYRSICSLFSVADFSSLKYLYISYFERQVLLDVTDKLLAEVFVIQMQHRVILLRSAEHYNVVAASVLQCNNFKDIAEAVR
jgi:hypothetical protein